MIFSRAARSLLRRSELGQDAAEEGLREGLELTRLDLVVVVGVDLLEDRKDEVVSERQPHVELLEEGFHEVAQFFAVEKAAVVLIVGGEKLSDHCLEIFWVFFEVLRLRGDLLPLSLLKILGIKHNLIKNYIYQQMHPYQLSSASSSTFSILASFLGVSISSYACRSAPFFFPF